MAHSCSKNTYRTTFFAKTPYGHPRRFCLLPSDAEHSLCKSKEVTARLEEVLPSSFELVLGWHMLLQHAHVVNVLGSTQTEIGLQVPISKLKLIA